MKSRTLLLLLALLTAITAAASALFYFQYADNVARREMRTEARQVAMTMAGELDVAVMYHKRTVSAFSRLPQVHDFILNPAVGDAASLATMLQLLCESIDGSLCYLLNHEGTAIAVNALNNGADIVGENYSFRPYFKQALKGKTAVYLAKGVTTGKRGVYFAHPVLGSENEVLGVAVMKVPPRFLGLGFASQPGRAILLSPDNVVFSTNYPTWLLKTFLAQASAQNSTPDRLQFGERSPEQALDMVRAGDSLVSAQGKAYIAGEVDVDALPGWRTIYLIDHANSMREADSWIAWAFTALSLVMLVVVFLLYRGGVRERDYRHTAEQALRESESRLRRLTELSSEAIIIHHNGMVLDANAAAEELFGYDRVELMLQEIWQLIGQTSQDFARKQEDLDCEIPYEVEGLHATGRIFPMEITAKQTVLEGELVRVACMRDISNRKAQENHVRFLAMYDSLTRLPNRHNLLEQLDNAILHADNLLCPLHLLFVDLDDFKKVNDSLGHSVGDRLLVAVAERMGELIEVDETLARYGGDEFLILLNNKSEARVQVLANQVLDVLRQPFSLEGSTFYISGSVGIARYPEDASTSSDLLRKADTAMYASKDDGRNTWNFFDAGMNTVVSERIQLEQNLRHALARNELSVHYQPVFFAGDERVVAAEALLRWHSEALGFVGPDRFIPVAEQTGIIEEIGRWVIEQACHQARDWREQGLSPFYISVNLSPRQFRDPELISFLEQTLGNAGIPGSTLVLELTEGVLMEANDKNQRVISELSRLGIGIAMDDFGTGYSSLSYLKRFPFNTLKIDREFVRDLETDPGDQQLIVATIAMAKALGMRVVAEGVENDAQKQFLKLKGVDYLQGYLLSRPITPAEFAARFVRKNADNTAPERQPA